MYASWHFYSTTYGGSLLTEENYDQYGERASVYLDNITRKRADRSRHRRSLSLCCCALADQYYQIDQLEKGYAEQAGGGLIASETVGDHSVSYRQGSVALQTQRAALFGIAQNYLAFTGLLYSGIPVIDGGKR